MRYEQLPTKAQAKARAAVLAHEIAALDARRAHYMGVPLNRRVNSRKAFRGYFHNRANVRRWVNDPQSFAAMIIGNILDFLADGTYIVYCGPAIPGHSVRAQTLKKC